MSTIALELCFADTIVSCAEPRAHERSIREAKHGRAQKTREAAASGATDGRRIDAEGPDVPDEAH
jgi:hypothetical protein